MIDKRLLTDMITVQLKGSKNAYGDVEMLSEIVVKPVRFDRSTAVSGLDNSHSKTSAGTIFIYPRFSDVVIDDSWIGAKVSDGIKRYTVVSYLSNYLNGRIFSYEIEVI